jgi:hypothetical protein
MLHTPMHIIRIDKLVQLVVPDRESVVAECGDVMIGYVCSFGRDRDDTSAIMMVSRITAGSEV